MMKRKHTLYLAILLGLLVSMAAVPVLADDGDIPMWVHRARLIYTGRSSGGPDMMVAYIHIRDAENNMVDGADVSAEWTAKIGEGDDAAMYYKSDTIKTTVQGIAIFEYYEGAGDYKICVTGVEKDGWEWTSGSEEEDCAIYWLPPYPYPYYTKP